MDNAKKIVAEKTELCDTLQSQINEFSFSNIDLGFLEKIQSDNRRFEQSFNNLHQNYTKNKKINYESNLKQNEFNNLYFDTSDEDSELVDRSNQRFLGFYFLF